MVCEIKGTWGVDKTKKFCYNTDMEKILDQFKNHLIVRDMSNSYVPRVRQYLYYCEMQGVDYLDADKIKMEFLEGLILNIKAKGRTKGTVDNYIKAIRFFYKFLVNRDLVDGKVIKELYKVKLNPPERKIRDYLTKEELDELIMMAEGWYRGMDITKLRALLYFMFFTGVRIGELINLKRKYINLEERESLIKLPNKGKQERYVFFTKEVKKHLEIYFDLEEEETNAFNVTTKRVTNLIKYIEQFTKKKITPHSLRHSFAHYLALNQVDIKVAQKLLGHKNLASTEIYYDPTIETVKQIYKNKLG